MNKRFSTHGKTRENKIVPNNKQQKYYDAETMIHNMNVNISEYALKDLEEDYDLSRLEISRWS